MTLVIYRRAINLGKTLEDQGTRTISESTRLSLEQTSEGANAALEIKSEDNLCNV